MLRALGIAPDIRTFLLVFTALYAVRIVTLLASQNLSLSITKKLQIAISSKAFATVMQAYGLQEIEEKSIGYFIGIAGDEAARVANVILLSMQFIASAVLAGMYFLAIYHYSSLTALGVLAFLVVTFICLLGVFRKSQQLGEVMIEQGRLSGSIFMDSLNGLRAVRAFSAENYVGQAYHAQLSRYVGSQLLIDVLNVVSRNVPVLVLLLALGIFASVGRTAGLTDVNFPALVTMLVLLMRFFPSVGTCLNVLLRVVAEAKVGKDVTAVVERHRPSQAHLKPLEAPVDSLVVRDLSFSYDGKVDVIRNLSLDFRRGRSYAILGPSGVGKSTLLDLIMKFYAAGPGTIQVNGTPIDQFADESLRARILVLGQRTTIFNDTVFNNLTFGRPAPLDAVQRACRLAEIDEFIQSLPDGYQTILAYQGGNLSGGQSQRIALARALLREPDVLILDESTSALDQETRDRVVSNILAAYREKLVIFVTHDRHVASRVDTVFDLASLNQAVR
jgi:ABC-type bacteriocin/lantibiotic exporter with double-glycine peptidase domain